ASISSRSNHRTGEAQGLSGWLASHNCHSKGIRELLPGKRRGQLHSSDLQQVSSTDGIGFWQSSRPPSETTGPPPYRFAVQHLAGKRHTLGATESRAYLCGAVGQYERAQFCQQQAKRSD